jgi:DNA-binding LacI/PurR family transcriptional regulator
MSSTLQDIADHLQVSRMTVSKALRGVGTLRPETRQRVLETAQAMGYRLNSSARAMRSKRTGAVALIMSSMADGRSRLASEMLHGINLALAERNMHLVMAELPDALLTSRAQLPAVVRDWAVDGFLLNYTHKIPQGLAELIDLHAIPTVWMNTDQPNDCVRPDDRGGAAEATRRLIALGHRRIAYACWDISEHYSRPARLAGYRQAMRDAGLDASELPSAVNIGPGEATTRVEHLRLEAQHRAAQIERALRASDRPTALLCYGRSEALAAAQVAARVGLRVPEDLSILGIDVRPIESGLQFISTALIPTTAVGSRAVQMLMDKIADPALALPPAELPFTYDDAHTCVAGALANAGTTHHPRTSEERHEQASHNRLPRRQPEPSRDCPGRTDGLRQLRFHHDEPACSRGRRDHQQ